MARFTSRDMHSKVPSYGDAATLRRSVTLEEGTKVRQRPAPNGTPIQEVHLPACNCYQCTMGPGGLY